MCGIIGDHLGPAGPVGDPAPVDVLDVLLEGLARLEYRGYDSAGLALVGADGEPGCGGPGRPTAPARWMT